MIDSTFITSCPSLKLTLLSQGSHRQTRFEKKSPEIKQYQPKVAVIIQISGFANNFQLNTTHYKKMKSKEKWSSSLWLNNKKRKEKKRKMSLMLLSLNQSISMCNIWWCRKINKTQEERKKKEGKNNKQSWKKNNKQIIYEKTLTPREWQPLAKALKFTLLR